MNLNIPATIATPSVIYNASTGTLELVGQSYPEDSIPFYRAIQKQLEEYLKTTRSPITIAFGLDYFNTSTSKCLLDFLEALAELHSSNGNISVIWYYQEGDEDIMESGEDFAREVKLPFKLIALPR